jgi:hypothetical protein
MLGILSYSAQSDGAKWESQGKVIVMNHKDAIYIGV